MISYLVKMRLQTDGMKCGLSCTDLLLIQQKRNDKLYALVDGKCCNLCCLEQWYIDGVSYLTTHRKKQEFAREVFFAMDPR